MLTMLNDPSAHLSVHGNLILSPLGSIDLHSPDWFWGREAYGWACACSWTWDLMSCSAHCLCWRLLQLSGVPGLSVLMTLIKNVTSSRATARTVSGNNTACQAGAKFSTAWCLIALTWTKFGSTQLLKPFVTKRVKWGQIAFSFWGWPLQVGAGCVSRGGWAQVPFPSTVETENFVLQSCRSRTAHKPWNPNKCFRDAWSGT